MKEIMLKEWREQMKVALLGLAILIFLLTLDYRAYTRQLENMNAPGTPLMDGELFGQAAFFCAIFGMALGWLQIRAEKHRDLPRAGVPDWRRGLLGRLRDCAASEQPPGAEPAQDHDAADGRCRGRAVHDGVLGSARGLGQGSGRGEPRGVL